MAFTPLPPSPSLENLKKRAKTLLKSVRAGQADALDHVGPYFGDPAAITLQQAQLVIARSHGFSSWTRLKAHIDGTHDHSGDQNANRFLDLVTVAYGPVQDFGPKRFEMAADLLTRHPEIATANVYTAAAIGDAAGVSAWLDRDPSLLNKPGGFFMWPPIMYAAYARLPGRSSWSAGQSLLARGADPNAHYMWAGQYRFTALTGVFGQGEGGPVNQPEHPDMVAFARALLDAGANPNDSQAGYNRCFDPDNTCLELLLEYGLNARDNNNWFLHEAGQLVPHPSETMRFQMFQAIHRGFADRVRLLIDHAADLDTPDDSYDNRTRGKTPYQAALLLGQSRIAELLAQAGADTDPGGSQNAFEAACMAGDTGKAQAVLEDTPDVMTHVRQRDMLCDAVKLGNAAALETMISLGFDLNIRPGRTPLHEAALSGDLEMVERLLAAGADATLREENYFQPPVGWAIHAGNEAVIDRLDRAPMDIFTAAARGNLARLSEHLARDPAALDARFITVRPGDAPSPNDWMTPLAYAVATGRVEAVRDLLARGADTGVTDGKGTTLLTLADTHENKEVLSLLEQHLSGQ